VKFLPVILHEVKAACLVFCIIMWKSYQSFCMVTGFNVDDTKAGLTNARDVGIIAELFA
jgi:hypothetical protein